MGRELAGQYAAARSVFDRADTAMGFALSDLMWHGPEAGLNDTVNTQPALFVHSIAAFETFRSLYPDFHPAMMAGHSLGELSAISAVGSLGFRDGLLLVRRRGELMKRAGDAAPGGMAAILNLDIPALEGICAAASTSEEIVQVANDNSPGQVVISGAKAAVERAMSLAKEAGARRAIRLAVSIAAHSGLMESMQADWDAAVAEAHMSDAQIPVIGNVSAAPMRLADQLRQDIQRQMQSRVRWTETIQTAAAQGITTFVELGTGSVLLGLIRRIVPATGGYSLGTPDDFAALV